MKIPQLPDNHNTLDLIKLKINYLRFHKSLLPPLRKHKKLKFFHKIKYIKKIKFKRGNSKIFSKMTNNLYFLLNHRNRLKY